MWDWLAGKKRIMNYILSKCQRQLESKNWILLKLTLHQWSYLSCNIYLKRIRTFVFGRANSSEIYRWDQIPPPQTHGKWGQDIVHSDTVCCSHLFFSLPAGQCKLLWQPQIFFLPFNSYTESCRTKLCTESNPVLFLWKGVIDTVNYKGY